MLLHAAQPPGSVSRLIGVFICLMITFSVHRKIDLLRGILMPQGPLVRQNTVAKTDLRCDARWWMELFRLELSMATDCVVPGEKKPASWERDRHKEAGEGGGHLTFRLPSRRPALVRSGPGTVWRDAIVSTLHNSFFYVSPSLFAPFAFRRGKLLVFFIFSLPACSRSSVAMLRCWGQLLFVGWFFFRWSPVSGFGWLSVSFCWPLFIASLHVSCWTLSCWGGHGWEIFSCSSHYYYRPLLP